MIQTTRFFIMATILLWNVGFSGHIMAQEKNVFIQVRASDWKPYIYKTNNEFKGFAYGIVRAVLDRAGVQATYAIQPWARVYKDGLTKHNYMICGIGRIPKRENDFKWIGPVAKQSDIYFYKLKRNPARPKNLEQIKEYMTMVLRDSFFEDFLIDNGFTEDQNYMNISDHTFYFKMLINKRIDYALVDEVSFNTNLKTRGYDKNLFEKALFAFAISEYMAFGRNTSPQLFERVKKAYDELKSEGKIQLR